MSLALEVSDADLLEAIRLRSANCYTALSFANALGGQQTIPWQICHTQKFAEMIAEAELRKLDLNLIKSSIDEIPVPQTMGYRYAKEIITYEQLLKEFREWKTSIEGEH